MVGPRNWLELDEHAEEIRERVAHWEHHAPAPVTDDATAAIPQDDFDELREMLDDLRETEGELRFAGR
jgi:hypothetical protein